MKSNKYSANKLVNFPDKIQSFREDRVTAPIYVRVKPINVCDHHCHFCCVFDTLIDGEFGPVEIKDIKVGDRVFTPTGVLATVNQTSSKIVDGCLEIRSQDRSIKITPNHPMLTSMGWTDAGNVRVGDSAVMQMRLRRSSSWRPRNMERVYREPSADIVPVGQSRIHGKSSKTHDGEQPNEKCGNSRKSQFDHKMEAQAQIAGGHAQYQPRNKKADVWIRQSDEKSDNSPKSPLPQFDKENVKVREFFQGLGHSELHRINPLRHGEYLDRQKKSRLQSSKSEKMYRDDSRSYVRVKAKVKNRGQLRLSNYTPLQQEQLELSGNLSEVQVYRGAQSSDSRLCIAGLQLERNLVLRQIDSIIVIPGAVEVFNFSCEPDESYIANGFAVHNCSYHSPDFSGMHPDFENKDRIPATKMFEILDDFKDMGVKALTFSGGGEPLLYRDIVPVMEKVLEYGIDLSIITNGQSLKEARAAVLSKAKWVRVSIDYTTAAEMATSRSVPEKYFQAVLDNLTAFAKIKGPDCDLAVNYIVTRGGCHNLRDITQKLKDCGVQNVRFSPVWTPGFQEYHAAIKDEVQRQLTEMSSMIDDNFSINTTYDLSNEAHGAKRRYTRCFFMQTVPVIGADQNVYACHNKAYDVKGLIGSIKDRRFKDLWFSEEAATKFKCLNPTTDCCHQCANDAKNHLINSLMETAQDNFV